MSAEIKKEIQDMAQGLQQLADRFTELSKKLTAIPEDAALGFPSKQHSTPNMGGRIRPLGVVFHHSGSTLDSALSWIKKPQSQVSYHMMIDQDGAQHLLVPFNRRAWACGASEWQGRKGCNSFMVSIAFTGNTASRDLTDAEIESAVQVVRQGREKYGWTYEWMTDHRQVSPGRKNDLHPAQWKRLALALKAAF